MSLPLSFGMDRFFSFFFPLLSNVWSIGGSVVINCVISRHDGHNYINLFTIESIFSSHSSAFLMSLESHHSWCNKVIWSIIDMSDPILIIDDCDECGSFDSCLTHEPNASLCHKNLRLIKISKRTQSWLSLCYPYLVTYQFCSLLCNPIEKLLD